MVFFREVDKDFWKLGHMGGKMTKLTRFSWYIPVFLAGFLILGTPGKALALHQGDESSCYNCHTLNQQLADPDTSFINNASRTLPTMRTENGGTAPVNLGCTYCHSNDLNNKMKNALTHFDNTKVSKHPVGYNYQTLTNTNTEYMSTINSTPIVGEIRCIDCHDPTVVTYPDHQTVGNGGTWDQVNNPYGLRNVTAVKAYDDLCRVCHQAVPVDVWGNPTDVGVTSHNEGSSAVQGNPGTIEENDGTPLQTTTAANVTNKMQCSLCHDSHFSTKQRLFGDGHEGDAIIDEANCTSTCHWAGDSNNDFNTHGHGKATATLTGGTMGLICTSCHNASTEHSGTSTDYQTRNRLTFALQGGETASSFGNPTYSICYICHNGYKIHEGTLNAGGSFTTGCTDCHDEHAEGAGVGGNIYMIPDVSKPTGTFGAPAIPKAGTEAVNYTLQMDYYRADASGACDNTECHAGIGPLSGIMGVGGTHPGGQQNPGDDCKSCHKHGKSNTPPHNLDTDAAGAWRASGSCSDCHAYPPNTNAHITHFTTAGFDCALCHPTPGGGSTTHNESLVTDSADYASRNISDIRQNVDVQFDTMNPNGTYSQAKGARSGLGNGTCNSLYCHGADSPFPVADQGTKTAPAWNNTGPGGDGDCGTCHKVTAADPPGSFAHPLHAGNATGYSLTCNLCHVSTTTDGTSVIYPAHVNRQANVSFDAADARLDGSSSYGGTNTVGDAATDGADSCSATYCHSPGNDMVAPFGQAPAQALQWDGTASCWSCHGNGVDNPMPSYADLLIIDAAQKGNKHPKHVTANGFPCGTCHIATADAGATTILNRANHVNHAYDVAPDPANVATLDDFTYAAGSCSTANCHGGNSVNWNYDSGTNGHFTCDICHGEAGGTNLGVADANEFTFGDWVQSKIDNDNEYPNAGHGSKGKTCDECHDSTFDHDISTNLDGTDPGTTNTDNPFRLIDQDGGTAGTQFTCANTSVGCHQNSPAKDVVSHTRAEMVNAGGSPQVNTWHITPECVNCHDPHGDQASGAGTENLHMIQREIYDKAAFTLPAGPPPAEPTEQVDLEFTDDTTGADATGVSFAYLGATASNASSLCQECHETTDPDMTSFLDNTAPGVVTAPHPSAPDSNPGTCTGCHNHSEAFRPSGCNGCHTYPGLDIIPTTHTLTAAHDKHVGAPGTGGAVNKGFTCDKCHPNPAGPDHNKSGVTGPGDWLANFNPANVEIQFDGWNALNANGPTYNGVAADAGQPTPAPGMGGTGTCAGLYCHGNNAASQVGWGGSAPQPAWNGTAGCGTCHDATITDTTPATRMSTGNHTDHLSATYGPNFGDACSTCHTGTALTDATHVNTVKDLVTSTVDPTPTTLGADYLTGTQVCNNCHSTAAVNTFIGTDLAKANFSNGAYSLPCLNCHNPTDPGTNNVDGTGRVAPDKLGDDVNYGAEILGHNLTSGSYPVSTNAAANRACSDCHDTSATHLNNTDDTTFAGNRLLATVNGNPTGSTVTGLCEACHRTSGASPATKKSINTHSNSDYTGNLENQGGSAGGANAFTLNCEQCHEPHGMVSNGTGYNIYMINPTITVTAGTTVPGVRFEGLTGNYSFNDTLGTDADDICTTCHTNASNPGNPMTYNAGGAHAAPAYTQDERGNNCGACHIHNQDSNITTQDGLMPLACNGCHTYPGLPANGAHRLSPWSHDVHVGRPSNEAPMVNKGYSCTQCHNGASHNDAGISGPTEWGSVNLDNHVQVRFDITWNPATTNPADTTQDSSSYNDTTNSCSNLYCHGFGLASGGLTGPPVWGNPVTAACGYCHAPIKNAPGADLTSGNHFAHLGTHTSPSAYGPQDMMQHPVGNPGSWPPGNPSQSCGACHPIAFDLSLTCTDCHDGDTPGVLVPLATHVNRQVDFTNNDNTPNETSTLGTTAPSVDPPADSTDRCNNCHSTATVNAAVGTVLAKTNWDNTTYKLPCLNCHNGTDPATQYVDGTGNTAPDIYTTWTTNGHGAAGIDNGTTTTDSGTVDQVPPVRCETCHDINSTHLPPLAGNPWRLVAATNYGAAGGLDAFCSTQCHLNATPADHAYNVAQSEAKEATDTHPVATQVVPDTKYFQIPADADMPLYPDLAAKGSANGATDNISCVSCHDPHGVANSPVAGRTFSGANTEATDAQMTRFDYSGSGTGTTPLCVKCHK